MPSLRSILYGVCVLAPLVAAAPHRVKRQEMKSAEPAATAGAVSPPSSSPAAASPAAVSPAGASAAAAPSASAAAEKPAGGLTDVDILQFALTAEHLESEFYKQGFAKFPESEFAALGLTPAQIKSLKGVGDTEAVHVSTLLSTISGAGARPVEPCQYNFEAAFADAKTMVATARVLEAVGVSAYLGAAPLVTSPDVLTAAASIATVESRHQAFIRSASGAEPVPAPFDTPLGPRAVFTLAAQFITSCPEGSNLNIPPFPSIALQNPEVATPGSTLSLENPGQVQEAKFCAFVAPGGNQFSEVSNGSCQVPQGLQGEVYMMLTKTKSVVDAEVLAGPSLLQPS